MTSTWERPLSAWPLGAWIMAAMLVAVLGVAVSTSVLSPGLLLDAISLWPGLTPSLIAAIVVAFRRSWRRRAGAIPPLLVISWLILASASHLAGIPVLPSSSGELIGPADGPSLATVRVAPAGRLLVEAGTNDALYQIRFLRLGGPVGLPAAEETTGESGVNLTIIDGGTTEWFRYAGWRLLLDPDITWNLNLGGNVSGDLSSLRIGSLTLNGSGVIELGSIQDATPVAVLGSYQVTIPPGASATIEGEAAVPETWLRTENGYATGVDGWMISVAEGASLIVNQG